MLSKNAKLPFVLCPLLIVLCSLNCNMKKTPTYFVKHQSGNEFALNADPDKVFWKNANELTDFNFPWQQKKAPHTAFKALHDSSNLYFIFEVEDADIVLAENYSEKTDVVKEDRVELFFSPTLDIAEYYCLEMDPQGRVYDYKAFYYRDFYKDWTWPGLQVQGKITENGYILEGLIPLESFEKLGMEPAEGIITGIYRAEFSQSKEGINQKLIISIDILTEKPDFHVPTSFGKLVFE